MSEENWQGASQVCGCGSGQKRSDVIASLSTRTTGADGKYMYQKTDRYDTRCGLYLRISREEERTITSGNSISNQRILLMEYLDKRQEEGLHYAGEWIDDGYSGSGFERPGWQKLLQAAQLGQIDCILVKDLSRLGREYIQTGWYLTKIFPAWGIRVIAVGDGYDSSQADFCRDSLLIPIMNLMNDAYCRDVSNKVKSSQNARKRQGDYLGAFAPYGYRKQQADYHVLEPEQESAEVVRKIFTWRSIRCSPEKIARNLNVLLVPSPYTHKRLKNEKFQSGFLQETVADHWHGWSAAAVRRILRNPLYIGTLQQGKSYKISHKINKRCRVPKEQWISVPHRVEPIVSEEIFAACQIPLRRNKVAAGERK